MIHRFFLASLALLACSSPPPPASIVGAGCPSIAPTEGAPCSEPNLDCVYDECPSSGEVYAHCSRARTFVVSTLGCANCQGRACDEGSVCAARQAGASVECIAHTCGTGPLTCDCASGVGVACTLGGDFNALFTCRPGCGDASVCP